MMPVEKRAERRYLGATASVKVERRAQWILDQWAQDVSLRPGKLKEMVRAAFDCGITAAEVALTRAYEIFHATRDDQALVDRIAEFYLNVANEAYRERDWKAAVGAAEALVNLRGLAAPKKIEHSGSLDMDVDVHAGELAEMSEEDLRLMAKWDRVIDVPTDAGLTAALEAAEASDDEDDES